MNFKEIICILGWNHQQQQDFISPSIYFLTMDIKPFNGPSFGSIFWKKPGHQNAEWMRTGQDK